MIREPAARKLAHDLFDIYLAHNLMSLESFEEVVKIIMQAVRIDEMQQSIETTEALLESRGMVQ